MNIDCLKNAIGDSEANELMQIFNGLPRGQNELLGLIAASLILLTDTSNSADETAGSSAQTFSFDAQGNALAGIPADAKSMSITVYDNDAVFTLSEDGVPDYSGPSGHFLPQETTININSKNLSLFKINPIDNITPIKVYVTYFK